MIDIIFDILGVAHMASFAVGIGAAAFLELYLIKRFRARLDPASVSLLLMGHQLIRVAVIALWVTGLSLLYVRLAIYGDPFSAKLLAKLSVVTALTVNMMIIERFLIPRVQKYRGRCLSDIKPRTLALFGGIAGFSAGSWASALLLGGVGYLKSLDIPHLSSVLLPILGTATLVGILAGLVSASAPVLSVRGAVAQGD
ncbi:MAG: hypothetical protein ACWA5A_01855 [Marinibacterium sp.]